MKRLLPLLPLAFLLNVPMALSASFIGDDRAQNIREPITGEAYIAGNDVGVNAPVAGELFTAGQNVVVAERVDRSIFAAGRNITIRNGAGYNAYVAGQNIVLSGDFGHDVYVAGQSVQILEGTVIRGDLRVSAESIDLRGTVNGNIDAEGQNVSSAAEVGGTFRANAASLAFAGGSIGGDLLYGSRAEARNLEAVTVGGRTERVAFGAAETRNTEHARNALFGATLFHLAGALILGALLLWLFPGFVARSVAYPTTNYGAAFGRGCLAFILVPILIVVLFASVVGWQAALVLLLSFVTLIFVAKILGAVLLGAFLLRKLGNPGASLWYALLLGLVVSALVLVIPQVGPIIGLLLFFLVTVPVFGSFFLLPVRPGAVVVRAPAAKKKVVVKKRR